MVSFANRKLTVWRGKIRIAPPSLENMLVGNGSCVKKSMKRMELSHFLLNRANQT